MDAFTSALKAAAALIGGWLSARFGFMYPIIGVLCVCMMLDFVSAWVTAIYTGVKLQSRKCSRGIAKKVGLLCCLAVGFVVDWVAGTASTHVDFVPEIPISFAVMVGIWLILNELISIVENVGKTGVRIPFLEKMVHMLHRTVEQQSDISGKGNS